MVREAVTNVVRHSTATTCAFVVEGTSGRVRLTVTDDGRTPAAPPTPGIGGTGLKGLTERLAVVGGSLEAGPGPAGGFVVTAELPADAPEAADADMGTGPTLSP